MHALSAFEQVKLQEERDKLREELINLYIVVEAGDWSDSGAYMHIKYNEADAACNRAEKVIAETGEQK